MLVVIGSRLGTDIELSISGMDLDPISVGMDIDRSILGMVYARDLFGMINARSILGMVCALPTCRCRRSLTLTGYASAHTLVKNDRIPPYVTSKIGKNFRFSDLKIGTRIYAHTQRVCTHYADVHAHMRIACTCTFLRMYAYGSRMCVKGSRVCTYTHGCPVRKWLRRSSFLGKNFRFFPLTFTKKFLVENTQGAATAAKEI